VRTGFALLRWATVAFIALSQPAAAQSDADIYRAMGEVAGELQVCSVYFGVGARCLKDQEPALSRTYREASDKVGLLAISTGRAVGISDEAILAQDKLYAAEMMKSMRGNCTNIAVLLEKYKDFCQKLGNGADWRLKEWIGCAHASKKTCGAFSGL
jgi:hypothetical protein